MFPDNPPLQVCLFFARFSPESVVPNPSQGKVSDNGNTFIELYQQHFVRIYRYHLARTGNIEEAQDLTSETFHAALENFKAYDPARGCSAAWLTGIAQHKLADHIRKSQRTITITQIEDRLDDAPSPEDVSSHNLQMMQVSKALRNLPIDRAEALSLHFFAELSLSETAQVMHRSYNAVRKLIHRGLIDIYHQLVDTSDVGFIAEVNL